MHRYLRFQTALPSSHSRQPLGLFRASLALRDEFDLPAYTNELLDESIDWFNWNLPVPRLGSQDARPIFWFRTEAEACLAQIWNTVLETLSPSSTPRAFT